MAHVVLHDKIEEDMSRTFFQQFVFLCAPGVLSELLLYFLSGYKWCGIQMNSLGLSLPWWAITSNRIFMLAFICVFRVLVIFWKLLYLVFCLVRRLSIPVTYFAEKFDISENTFRSSLRGCVLHGINCIARAWRSGHHAMHESVGQVRLQVMDHAHGRDRSHSCILTEGSRSG